MAAAAARKDEENADPAGAGGFGGDGWGDADIWEKADEKLMGGFGAAPTADDAGDLLPACTGCSPCPGAGEEAEDGSTGYPLEV